MKDNKDDEDLTEIVTLQPSFNIGPIINSHASSTADAIRKMASGEVPLVPQFQTPCVDVRDVAQAHINALKMEPGTL